ncbi:MAG: ABC transporter substrate-binding protein [Candidatus Hydrogenedentes bacterium]|nr:ABC transporter substrate-binding protein [Candidatus Hydrogenedentota bacterium]
MRLVRSLSRAGLKFCLVLIALLAATQIIARLSWSLPESGPFPAGALPLSARVPWQSPQVSAVHCVTEWAVERGRRFRQAPMLEARVQSRELPAVEDRVPENPLVIIPPEQCGPYGGTWERLATSPGDIPNGIVGRVCYEGLTRYGPMGDEILPNVAERWAVEDDGRSFTFWLRRGMHWSDGAPFTVDDILFWYEDVLQNSELTPTLPNYLVRGGELMKVEKVDDFTVRFRFKEPYGIFLKLIAGRYGDYMIQYSARYMRQFHPRYTPLAELEKQAKQKRFDFWYQLFANRHDWTNPDAPRLTAWVLKRPPPAAPIVFERNPYYWKVDSEGNQLPYIDRVSVGIFDLETLNLKASNGEVGMQGRNIAFSSYPLFMENRERGGFRVLNWLDGGDAMNALCLNLNHKDPVVRGLMQDFRFRVALSLAINRDELNQVCYFGLGQPRQACPSPSSAYYSAEYEKAYIEYDPGEANRLLDEVGLERRDSHDFRLRPDGQPLRLTIETSSAMVYPQLIQLVADHWTAVGVKTEMRLLARDLWQRRVDALLHDVTVWTGAGEYIPILDPRYFFPHNIGSYYALNYMRWYTSGGKRGEQPLPDMLRCIDLYRQIEATPDDAEQVRLFKQILDIDRKNLWVIGLVGELPAFHIVKNTFRNVPENAVFTFVFRSPCNTAPECFAIEEN